MPERGSEPVLQIRDLRVTIDTDAGVIAPVDGIALSVDPGEIKAIVGESGSGKSLTALTVLGLSRARGTRCSGRIEHAGRNLLDLSEAELRSVRGASIGMIFQDPLSSLNPTMRVGDQITEMILLHERVSHKEANERTMQSLREVGIPQPEERARRYPHEFSGGMRQRVMIAMAMACHPRLLIADEPTTALDVTIQAQVLDLMVELRRDHGSAILLITHDLGIVAEVADSVAVMYAGKIVECGPCDVILSNPRHPYTWGLLASIPRVDRPRPDRLRGIGGQPPAPQDRPEGCVFRDRCALAIDQCAEPPKLWARDTHRPEHLDACWRSTEDAAKLRASLSAVA